MSSRIRRKRVKPSTGSVPTMATFLGRGELAYRSPTPCPGVAFLAPRPSRRHRKYGFLTRTPNANKCKAMESMYVGQLSTRHGVATGAEVGFAGPIRYVMHALHSISCRSQPPLFPPLSSPPLHSTACRTLERAYHPDSLRKAHAATFPIGSPIIATVHFQIVILRALHASS
jgi:hypothetical protein